MTAVVFFFFFPCCSRGRLKLFYCNLFLDWFFFSISTFNNEFSKN
jgi:hypothetical protein